MELGEELDEALVESVEQSRLWSCSSSSYSAMEHMSFSAGLADDADGEEATKEVLLEGADDDDWLELVWLAVSPD